MKPRLPILLFFLALAACERTVPEPPPVTPRSDAAIDDSGADTPDPVPSPAESERPARQRLVAEALVLEEWAKAGNRQRCAPLAFAATGGARGAPRPADFAGGWAVAFDLPNLRSAYGLAGPDIVSNDTGEPEAQRARLLDQWPYFRDLGALPQPAFAGYGVEGASPYPADAPNGRGLNSLAYVRVGGQACTYNVWSRLGRPHLETLLGELRFVSVDE